MDKRISEVKEELENTTITEVIAVAGMFRKEEDEWLTVLKVESLYFVYYVLFLLKIVNKIEYDLGPESLDKKLKKFFRKNSIIYKFLTDVVKTRSLLKSFAYYCILKSICSSAIYVMMRPDLERAIDSDLILKIFIQCLKDNVKNKFVEKIFKKVVGAV